MKKFVVFLWMMGLVLSVAGNAQSYSESFGERLSDFGTAWIPPHNTAPDHNYPYKTFEFTSDMTGSHAFNVWDNDANDEFIPVLYLYEGSFNYNDIYTNLLNQNDEYGVSSLTKPLKADTNYHLIITTSTPKAGMYDLDFAGTITCVPIPGAIWLLGPALLAFTWFRKKTGF